MVYVAVGPESQLQGAYGHHSYQMNQISHHENHEKWLQNQLTMVLNGVIM